jgi:nuclear pore complex protein Nup155
VTIDNKLYLWNYLRSEAADDNEFEIFDSMKEVIVSVSLASPKPDIFSDKVHYVLVVASPVEIVLVAVACTPSDDNHHCKSIKVILLDSTPHEVFDFIEFLYFS